MPCKGWFAYGTFLKQELIQITLEFQIEGEGGIDGRLANFGQNNKQEGGCNKRGGWQKSPKLINGEAGKNTSIRNFIEIKSSNDLVKISRNTKVVYLHEESLLLLLDSSLHTTSCFIVIRKQFSAMWKKQHEQQTVLWASHYRCRLCTWINIRGVWTKRRGWQNSPKLKNGECGIRLERVTKNGIFNKRGVPSIQNSRVQHFSSKWQRRWVKMTY